MRAFETQSGQGLLQPLRGGAALDGRGLARVVRKQRAAELVLLIAQHDARAARRGGRGRPRVRRGPHPR